MQAKKDIFSKTLSLKTIILATMIGIFITYAIVGIVISLVTEELDSSLLAKITNPLFVIGIGILVSIDNFRKIASDKPSARILGLITLILGVLSVILLTLLIWGIIPAYDQGYGTYSYVYAYTPSIAYKLIMSLLIIAIFTFLSSIITNLKDNKGLVYRLKFITISFLICASIVSIINLWADFSEGGFDSSTRLTISQYVLWIVAVVLGIFTFFLSKSNSWDKKAKALETTQTEGPLVEESETVSVLVESVPNDNKPTIELDANTDSQINPVPIDSDIKDTDQPQEPQQFE